MIEWRDEGVLLSVSPHGETSAIINVFTAEHGRHAGLVRGGTSRKMTPVLQPGAQLSLHWKARLEVHLGSFTVEPLLSRTGLMAQRFRLSALNAVTSLTMFSMSEREPHPRLYAQTQSFLERLEIMDDWPPYYIGWELQLLESLGFGLNLTQCAVSGETDDLIYVSPKTGRAVCAREGAKWADRLLTLPPFLRPPSAEQPITAVDLNAGFKLTGYFLNNRLCPALNHPALPQARERLEREYQRL